MRNTSRGLAYHDGIERVDPTSVWLKCTDLKMSDSPHKTKLTRFDCSETQKNYAVSFTIGVQLCSCGLMAKLNTFQYLCTTKHYLSDQMQILRIKRHLAYTLDSKINYVCGTVINGSMVGG